MNSTPRKIRERLFDVAAGGKRLSAEEALNVWEQADWTDVASAGHQMRMRLHPEAQVSYTAYRIINYTNICSIGCTFCSFMADADAPNSYILSAEDVRQKAEEARKLGADGIFLQGGVHTSISLEYYENLLHLLGRDMGFSVRGFSPVELKHIAAHYHISMPELLERFRKAGLSSVPGAGAEILTNRMRKELAPRKLNARQWCDIMGACHQAGLPGSANIVIGSTESPQDVVEHLNHIRSQQDATGGFLTFVPWTFQPQTDKFTIRHVKGTEYLKLLGLSRLFLDNISHIEVSVLGMGKSLGELGLYAGADDINSIVIEENVLKDAGLRSIEEAEAFIRQAGFEPVRRSMNFEY
jgi:cyclic dehypoxanthinyl futalosine synthase